MPIFSSSLVMKPARPSSRIQLYAPMKGGESMDSTTAMLMIRLPQMLKRVEM